MTLPSAEYAPPSGPESPIQQAQGLFIEATESYIDTIRAGMAAGYSRRQTAIREVARRAELMASSAQMLAGVLYDTDPARSEEELVGALFKNECMQADFYTPHIADSGALTDTIDEIGHYVTYAKGILREPAQSERALLLEVAKVALLSNSYVWMRTLNRGAGTS